MSSGASSIVPLDLTAASYADEGSGYASLRVTINGRRAFIVADQKPTLLEAGLVFVGSGDSESWGDILPPIDFKLDDGSRLRLEGFADDRRLFALYDRFRRSLNDGTFRPGPVDIPD